MTSNEPRAKDKVFIHPSVILNSGFISHALANYMCYLVSQVDLALEEMRTRQKQELIRFAELDLEATNLKGRYSNELFLAEKYGLQSEYAVMMIHELNSAHTLHLRFSDDLDSEIALLIDDLKKLDLYEIHYSSGNFAFIAYAPKNGILPDELTGKPIEIASELGLKRQFSLSHKLGQIKERQDKLKLENLLTALDARLVIESGNRLLNFSSRSLEFADLTNLTSNAIALKVCSENIVEFLALDIEVLQGKAKSLLVQSLQSYGNQRFYKILNELGRARQERISYGQVDFLVDLALRGKSLEDEDNTRYGPLTRALMHQATDSVYGMIRRYERELKNAGPAVSRITIMNNLFENARIQNQMDLETVYAAQKIAEDSKKDQVWIATRDPSVAQLNLFMHIVKNGNAKNEVSVYYPTEAHRK